MFQNTPYFPCFRIFHIFRILEYSVYSAIPSFQHFISFHFFPFYHSIPSFHHSTIPSNRVTPCHLSRNDFGRCRVCYTVKCFVQLVPPQCRQNIARQVARNISQCNSDFTMHNPSNLSADYCDFHNSAEFIFKRQRPSCVLADDEIN